MPTRTARTAWDGGLMDGSGQVELSSSGVGTYEVSFPRRTADDAQGVTSPEELIAAAHSACYAMQLSGGHRRGRRHAARRSTSRRTSRSARTRRAASGSPASSSRSAARSRASTPTASRRPRRPRRTTCPVSKALTGTTITLDAALVS